MADGDKKAKLPFLQQIIQLPTAKKMFTGIFSHYGVIGVNIGIIVLQARKGNWFAAVPLAISIVLPGLLLGGNWYNFMTMMSKRDPKPPFYVHPRKILAICVTGLYPGFTASRFYFKGVAPLWFAEVQARGNQLSVGTAVGAIAHLLLLLRPAPIDSSFYMSCASLATSLIGGVWGIRWAHSLAGPPMFCEKYRLWGDFKDCKFPNIVILTLFLLDWTSLSYRIFMFGFVYAFTDKLGPVLVVFGIHWVVAYTSLYTLFSGFYPGVKGIWQSFAVGVAQLVYDNNWSCPGGAPVHYLRHAYFARGMQLMVALVYIFSNWERSDNFRQSVFQTCFPYFLAMTAIWMAIYPYFVYVVFWRNFKRALDDGLRGLTPPPPPTIIDV